MRCGHTSLCESCLTRRAHRWVRFPCGDLGRYCGFCAKAILDLGRFRMATKEGWPWRCKVRWELKRVLEEG